MKTAAWMYCAILCLAAGAAGAQEPSKGAKKPIDVRGAWLADLAGLDQKFVIVSSTGGVLRGYGQAGGFTWDVKGSMAGRTISMDWPYREVGYSVSLEGKVDKKGEGITEGVWTDSNSLRGKWTAARTGGKDTLVINGTVKGGTKAGAMITLAQKQSDGTIMALQQSPLDVKDEYEFLVDVEGKYLVEISAGFCVDGPDTCKRQSKPFKLVDSGRFREQEKTVNFVRESPGKDF